MPRKRKSAPATTPADTPPTYTVVACEITAVVQQRPGDTGNPHITLEARELLPDGTATGASYIFRLYTTDKAITILRWFLAKFLYPADLMDPIRLKRSKLLGLRGKILFLEEEWDRAIGFSRLDETELEEKVARMTVPTVDVNADLIKELEWLDNL